MRVVCARPVPASAARVLTAHDLLLLCQDHDDDEQVVGVEAESDGSLGCAALRARLAPHAPAHTLLLEAAAGAGAGLRLRAARALRAGEELRAWPAPALLLAAQVPFLLPRHIRGWSSYVCDVCGESFSEPNPLKAHLFLRCAAPAPARFWRELLARLARLAGAAAPPADLLHLPSAGNLQTRLSPPKDRRAGVAGGHRCGYCGRVYSRRYGLRIHTRTHTGHKPLRCPHCARAFADPSNLNKHVRLHKARAAAAHSAEL